MLRPPLSSPSHTAETIISFGSTVSSHPSFSNTALTTPDLGSPGKTKSTLEPLLQILERAEESSKPSSPSLPNSSKPFEGPTASNTGLRIIGGVKVKDVASRFEQMRSAQTPSPTPPERHQLTAPRRLPIARSTPPLQTTNNRSTTLSSNSTESTVRPTTSVDQSTDFELPSIPVKLPSAETSYLPSPTHDNVCNDSPNAKNGPTPLRRDRGSTKKMIQRWESHSSTPTHPEVDTALQHAHGVFSREYLDKKPLPPPKGNPDDSTITVLPRHFTPSKSLRHHPQPSSTHNSPSHLRTPTKSGRGQNNLSPSPSGSNHSPQNSPSGKKQKVSPLKDVLNFLGARRKGKGKEKEKEIKKDYGALINENQGRFGVFIPKDRMGSAEMRWSPDFKPTIRSDPIIYLIPTPCSSVSAWDSWLPSWATLTSDALSITYCPVFPTPRTGSSDTPRRCSGSSIKSARGVPFSRISAPNPQTPSDKIFSMQNCVDVRVVKKDELKSKSIPLAPDGVGAEVIELTWEDRSRSYIAVEGSEGRNAWLTAIRGILPRTPVLPPITPSETPFGSISSPLRHSSRHSSPLSIPHRGSIGTVEDAGFGSFPSIQKVGDEWVAGGPLHTLSNDLESLRSRPRLREDSPLRESVSLMFADKLPSQTPPRQSFVPQPEVGRSTSHASSEASQRILEWQAPVQNRKELSISAQSQLLPTSFLSSGIDVGSATMSHSDTMLSFDSEDLNPSRSASQVGRVPTDVDMGEITPKQTRKAGAGEVKSKAAVWEARSALSSEQELDPFGAPTHISRITFPKPFVGNAPLASSPKISLTPTSYKADISFDHTKNNNLFNHSTSPSRTMRMALEGLLPGAPLAQFTTQPLRLHKNIGSRPNDPHDSSTETLVNTPGREMVMEEMPVETISLASTLSAPSALEEDSASEEVINRPAVRGPRPVSSNTFDRRVSSRKPSATSQTTPPTRTVTPAVVAQPSTSRDLAMGAVSSPSPMSTSGASQRPKNRRSLLSHRVPSTIYRTEIEKQEQNGHEAKEDKEPSSTSAGSTGLGEVESDEVHISAIDIRPISPRLAGVVTVKSARSPESDTNQPLPCPPVALPLELESSPILNDVHPLPPAEELALPTTLPSADLSKLLENVEVLVDQSRVMSDPETAPYPKALQEKLGALHEDLTIVRRSLVKTSSEKGSVVEDSPPAVAQEPLDLSKVYGHLESLEGRTISMADPETAPYPKVLEEKLNTLHAEVTLVRELIEETKTQQEIRTFGHVASEEHSQNDPTAVSSVLTQASSDSWAESAIMATPVLLESRSRNVEMADGPHPQTELADLPREQALAAAARNLGHISPTLIQPSMPTRPRPARLTMPAPLAPQASQYTTSRLFANTPRSPLNSAFEDDESPTKTTFAGSESMQNDHTVTMPEPYVLRTPVEAIQKEVVPQPIQSDVSEIHRKLDHLTAVYRAFIDQQHEVATGSRVAGTVAGEIAKVPGPTNVGGKPDDGEGRLIFSESEMAGTDNGPFSGRFSTIMCKGVESASASGTPTSVASQNPVPSLKEEIEAPNEVENVIVEEQVARPEAKNEEEKYAGEEVAKIMGENSDEPKPLKQQELHVLSNVPTPSERGHSEKGEISSDQLAVAKPPSPIIAPMTVKFPEETLKKMEKAMGILTELDEARGFQKTQAADMGKYLTDLNGWLEKFVQNSSTELDIMSKRLDTLVGPESSDGSQGLPALVADMHSMLVGQKHRNEVDGMTGQRLDTLVMMMGQDQQRQATQESATAEILQVLERQRHENEMLLRALATDLTEEIRGDKMRFLESMQKATTVNVMLHIEEFKRLLNAEVNKSMNELGKVREEKRALEQQISDLFALKAKHGIEPRALPKAPSAAAGPPPPPSNRP
ncbi:hypothetical protein D1P53_002116 [Cryptococcus gattii VGV]|nr:hypothetical protein D1P53_002116 [Cryptococcus gattii VGV]